MMTALKSIPPAVTSLSTPVKLGDEDTLLDDMQFSDEEGMFEMDFEEMDEVNEVDNRDDETESTEIIADEDRSQEENVTGPMEIPTLHSILAQVSPVVQTTVPQTPTPSPADANQAYSFEKDIHRQHPHFASLQENGKYIHKPF